MAQCEDDVTGKRTMLDVKDKMFQMDSMISVSIELPALSKQSCSLPKETVLQKADCLNSS